MHSRILIVILILSLQSFLTAWGFGANGSGEKDIDPNPLQVTTAVLAPAELEPGQGAELKINFHLPPGHHAYVDQFKLEIESPTNIFLGELEAAPITPFHDPVSKKEKMGVEGDGTLTSLIKLPSNFKRGDHRLQMIMTYQACTKEYCLFPQKIPVTAAMKVGGPATMSDDPLAAAMQKGLWAAFLLAFIAGILTSFTPCIFPMIPITLAVLGTKDTGRSRGRGLTISLCYVCGIALTYAVLGVAAAKTGALFGSLLGHPVVVGVIAVIFILMGLSMFGLFEVKMPDRLANALVRKFGGDANARGTFGSAFATGLLAGVVASPCVGPVLVSILTYVAQTQDTFLGFWLLFVFALGLGQIFILLGTFSQLMQRLPRSGPWLGYVKFIFGSTMIAMALYFLYPVAKPWLMGKLGERNGATRVDCGAGGAEGVNGDGSSLSCPADGAGDEGFAKPPWQKYSEEKLAEARATGRPVIIDIKAEWCAACHELEKYTFSDSRVLAFKEILWLEFDATSDSPELTELRQKYKILGLPFVTFYDAAGNWRGDLTLTGFEDADAFLARLRTLGIK